MKKWAWALSLLLLAPIAFAHDPPSDLRWEVDHWTAWTPPAPTDAAEVYTIQAGDTLWDLAVRFLGDGYLWPQLWEQNQYILDAHWIYPGDPLIVGASTSAMADGGDVAALPLDDPNALDGADLDTEEVAPLDPKGRLSIVSGSDGPVPLGHESDIYCSGYIDDAGQEFPYAISGSEYDFLSPSLDAAARRDLTDAFGAANSNKFGLSVGDIAYIDGGRADGLSPGDLLTAVRPREMVAHPRSKKPMGQYYHYEGRLRVLSVQDSTAIAEIVMACDMVRSNSMLKVFEPEPVPLRRLTPMRPVNYPAPDEEIAEGASIVYARDTAFSLGSGHLVFIDRGSEDDVAPGDIYTVYRQTRPGVPAVVLGEVAVLSSHRRTSLARILSSRYTVYIGDTLLPK